MSIPAYNRTPLVQLRAGGKLGVKGIFEERGGAVRDEGV